MITYHTDGSCRPTNPGPGGYAVIRDGFPWVMACSPHSTNIVMEGKAMLAALNDADGRTCTIYSDSEFWINVLTKWAPGWKAKGWKKSSGEIKNLDLVKELYKAYVDSDARLVWVKGHADDVGNIMADKYALIASGSVNNGPTTDEELEQALIDICKAHYELAPDEQEESWCGTCAEVSDVASKNG